MSEPVSALNGASFGGYCDVTEIGLRGMVTLRGDLSAAAFKKVIEAETGLTIPGQRKIVHGKAVSLAWMSPDELLLLVSYRDATLTAARLADSLDNQHAMAVDVSDARASFRIEGSACREVLAKLAPVELYPGAFGPGDIRRTRLAQVAGAIWMPDEASFEVVCFRSVARYVFDLLSEAARHGGQVGYPEVT